MKFPLLLGQAIEQGADSISAVADSLGETVVESKSIFEIAQSGGYLMIVLLLFSFVAMVIVIERFLRLGKSKRDEQMIVDEVYEKIRHDDLEGAAALCDRYPALSVTNIYKRGLSALETGLEAMEQEVETCLNSEIHKLEKNLGTLSTIAAVGPLVGFLGTVTGMVRVFYRIAGLGGGVDISLLAGGISEALVTTIGGLFVGILAILFYNYFVGKIEERAHELNERSSDFTLLLRKLS